jgi:hypothetical protein
MIYDEYQFVSVATTAVAVLKRSLNRSSCINHDHDSIIDTVVTLSLFHFLIASLQVPLRTQTRQSFRWQALSLKFYLLSIVSSTTHEESKACANAM